jgi:nicotinate (nicotinamide) nucleotide adenylyltransferase
MTTNECRTSIDGVVWQIVARPGYAGHRRDELARARDARYGEGRWRIGYWWRGALVTRDTALGLYEEAYFELLRRDGALLDWLCASASEVYDTAPSNVASGLDYLAQEGGPTHLQDIAIRRVVGRLGRRFEGREPMQIRGRRSPGHVLNPGRVPFHAPRDILRPALGGWWDPGSIEDFWQSNKVLLAREPAADALREELFRPLAAAKGDRRRVALYGGSFNPIHLGHLRVAQDLLDLHGFDKVVFVPNGEWYRKRHLAPAADRLHMVRLAVEGEARFVASAHEVESPAQVLVPDSVARVRALVGDADVHVVRGSDAVPRMLAWASFPAIVAAARVLVVERPGAPSAAGFGGDLRFRLVADRFSFLARGYDDGLSSSLVRERIAGGGSPRFFVPPSVAAFLAERGLYRGRP